MNNKPKLKKITCPKCGYRWEPRTEKPVSCPDCKKRLRLKNPILKSIKS